jgi:hypothetical protein
MTTTRINHTGHDHPNTTAARTACRTALRKMAETPAPVVRNVISVKGGAVHAPNAFVDGAFPLCRNGSMSNLGTRYRLTDAPVSCRNCR